VSLKNGKPVELEGAQIRQEILAAIGRGIVVIAAAGNRSHFLSQPFSSILVGAGAKSFSGPTIDPNTNTGPSIDCFAWGQGIICGTRSSAADPPGWGTFQDTSAAAALVAGVVGGVQSVRRAAGKSPLSHAQVRAMLRTPGLGSTPVNGIGTMPHAGRMCARALQMP
jgi:hypothetical protein